MSALILRCPCLSRCITCIRFLLFSIDETRVSSLRVQLPSDVGFCPEDDQADTEIPFVDLHRTHRLLQERLDGPPVVALSPRVAADAARAVDQYGEIGAANRNCKMTGKSKIMFAVRYEDQLLCGW